MSKTPRYLCVSATTGELITRDGRACFATAAEWGDLSGTPIIGPNPTLVLVGGEIHGMVPLVEPPVSRIQEVINMIRELTVAERSELAGRLITGTL